MASTAPSPGPSPGPTPGPTPAPTPGPTPGPTPAPITCPNLDQIPSCSTPQLYDPCVTRRIAPCCPTQEPCRHPGNLKHVDFVIDKASTAIELTLYWISVGCRMCCVGFLFVSASFGILTATGVIPVDFALDLLLFITSFFVPQKPGPPVGYGRCPDPKTKCHTPFANVSWKCATNKDCESDTSRGFICCESSCGDVCFNPEYYSGLMCPPEEYVKKCEYPPVKCVRDSNCRGKVCCELPKCGGQVCTKPLEVKFRGRCEPIHMSKKCPKVRKRCRKNEDCVPRKQICCNTRCGWLCVPPFVNDIVCPSKLIECTPARNQSRCKVDAQCGGFELCCFVEECRGWTCQRPLYIGAQGRCPPTRRREPCETDVAEQCKTNRDCPGDLLCCLMEECGKVCVEPNESGYVCSDPEEGCPPEPMLCGTDNDCLHNFICCNSTTCGGDICVVPLLDQGWCPPEVTWVPEPVHCEATTDCKEPQVCCRGLMPDPYDPKKHNITSTNCFDPMPFEKIAVVGTWGNWSEWTTCYSGGCTYSKNRTCAPVYASCKGDSKYIVGCSFLVVGPCTVAKYTVAGAYLVGYAAAAAARLTYKGAKYAGKAVVYGPPPEDYEPPTHAPTTRKPIKKVRNATTPPP